MSTWRGMNDHDSDQLVHADLDDFTPKRSQALLLTRCCLVVRRNEIIAMFNTLSKLSQSIRTIGFMSALLEDPMSAQPSRILDT